VNLSCTIYKDGVSIATMDPQTVTYELEEYEAGSCYNIECENDDMASVPFIKFSGNFITRTGTPKFEHDAWQKPYWLAGSGIGGCIDLAPSCKEVSVTIESWRNPSPAAKADPVELLKYMCASKTITCNDLCTPQPCEDKKDKFSMFRYKEKDDKCETKCVPEKEFAKKELEGYSFCPCKKTPPPTVPKPDSCVLKRGDQLMKFSPNIPAMEAGVYVEVYVVKTGHTYQFKNFDTSLPEFKVEDQAIFQEMKFGEELWLRFVSRNGPGGWNTCRYSPIGLDLDGDGVVSRIEGEFRIDITGDGVVEEMNEWFAPQEGILINIKSQVRSDGVVTGVHLIGNQGGKFTDGFQKLTGYDKNGDGIVKDNELKDFRIWVDVNSNTLLDLGEMHKLEEYGIVGLHTAHTNMVSTAVLQNGGEMMMEDLWFSR
jgi:hypothetical protein